MRTLIARRGWYKTQLQENITEIHVVKDISFHISELLTFWNASTSQENHIPCYITKDKKLYIKTCGDDCIYAQEDISNMFAYFPHTKIIDGLELINTSATKYMDHVFYGCGNATSQNVEIKGLKKWDTSNVISSAQMFYGVAESAPGWDIDDLSNWNTSNIVDMTQMFYRVCTEPTFTHNLNLSKWNVSRVCERRQFTNNRYIKKPKFWQ